MSIEVLQTLRPEPLHWWFSPSGLCPLPGSHGHPHLAELPTGPYPTLGSPRGVQHRLEDPPSGVDEPVVDLEEAEAGLAGEVAFLVLRWVRVLENKFQLF